MRQDSDTGSEVYYILTDHLGSTSLTVYEDELGQMQVKARQWYKPWGEIRQVTGEMPTDYQYTGQKKDSSIGMLWYGSRFYDAALGRFSQPDSIVPNVFYTLAYDRYQYVFSNPLKYIDPDGHKACQWGDPNPACNQFSDVDYQLEHQIQRPDATCLNDEDCKQAYLTYKELVWDLHYVPSTEQILYMTAQAEYGPYINYPGASTMGGVGLRALGQEGLARSYYEAFGREDITCTGSQLYRFMSGYQPWIGHDKTTPAERATKLIYHLDRNDNREDFMEDVTQILDYTNASQPQIPGVPAWTAGKWIGRPWQWKNYTEPPNSLGYYLPAEAIGYIEITGGNYGNYFWVLSADQNDNKKYPPSP